MAPKTVNQMAAGKDTVYYNSPEKPKADIVHSLVPERQVASEIFGLAQTKQNVRDAAEHVRTAERRNSTNVPQNNTSAVSSPNSKLSSSVEASDEDEEVMRPAAQTPPPLLSPEKIEKVAFPQNPEDSSSSSSEDEPLLPVSQPTGWRSYFPCCCGRI